MSATMISAVTISAILAASRHCGLPSDLIAREAKLGALLDSDNASLDGFVEREQLMAVWRGICARDERDGVGVRIARAGGKGSFRGLEYLVRTSDTLAGGLERLIRFQQLLRVGARIRLAPGPGDSVAIVFEHDREYEVDSRPERARVEYGVAALVHLARDMLGPGWRPVAVEFEHGLPNDKAAYTFFGRTVGSVGIGRGSEHLGRCADWRLRESRSTSARRPPLIRLRRRNEWASSTHKNLYFGGRRRSSPVTSSDRGRRRATVPPRDCLGHQ